MHPTALNNCKLFFDNYSEFFNMDNIKVVEIGSQDVNGSLRSVCPANFSYLGLDFVEGKGVDVVLDDPYSLPLDNESVDIVLSSSCFEHSEMFWLVFLEIMRVLKPSGLFYLNAPSNGYFHRYPVDCWRFYPDSGSGLVKWAERNNIPAGLVESYISNQHLDLWNDFVAVFIKNKDMMSRYKKRIINSFDDFKNGVLYGHDEFFNKSDLPEDRLKLLAINKIINNEIKIL